MLKKIITFSLTAIVLLSGCGNPKSDGKAETVKKDSLVPSHSAYTDDCKSLFQEAAKMDSLILIAKDVDPVLGNKTIKSFCDFSYYCKSDSLAPVFLIKASQIAQTINNLPQAQVCLEKCISDFPDFKNRGAAMFLLAQLYDEVKYLNDETKAEQLYKDIMTEYPGTAWATNARAAKELLGKSDEQIIKEFNKKNKK